MAKKQNKDDNIVAKKIQKPLVKLNSLFNDLIDNISFNTFNSDTKREKDLKILSNEIDNIVYNEIKSLTSFTGDEISTFLVKLFNDYDNKSMSNIKSIEDIFSSDKNSGIFDFFKERYKNLYLKYDDLNLIYEQLPELQEAISSTRDAIVTSDDISQTISRTFKFKNINDNETQKQSYIGLVENMEKNFKLINKLKNHIIPNTLKYGRYYVYTIPYSKLFERYYNNTIKKQMLNKTLESADIDYLKDFKNELNISTPPSILVNKFNNYIKDVEIYNDEISIPVIEKLDIIDLLDNDKFKKEVETSIKESEKKNKPSNVYIDGISNINKQEIDFSNIGGCYIKLIDPRKIIPVKILDKVIGYYYIHDLGFEVNKSPFTTSISINPTNNNVNNVENLFLSKLSDKIIKAFDKKFLENNIKFKELIINALTYNELYKKQIKFQFIPVDYITEFSINEDEDGNGTSVLIRSLFYAKLYLALLIFKMISILSKSNDTKIYYVKNSGLDQDIVNQIQDVARSVKERQPNFMDLLNYNSMISKIGQMREIFMPMGRSGERGIEFDVLAGQDIQLNTDLMEMLKNGYINSTGVPSVIMNYINEADYAKTLVMANAKFVGRVVNDQIDFNGSCTEWYKKVMNFSLDIPKEIIEGFEFTLNPPKSLNNMNLSDMISNSDQLISFMIKAKTGENSSPSDDDNKLKDLSYELLAREQLPMLPWNRLDEIIEDCKLKLEKITGDNKLKGTEETQ